MSEWEATIAGALIAGLIGWLSSITIEARKEKRDARQCEKIIRSQFYNWSKHSLDLLIERLEKQEKGEARKFIMPEFSFPISMDKAEKLKESDLNIILDLEHEHKEIQIYLDQQYSCEEKIKRLKKYSEKFSQISFL